PCGRFRRGDFSHRNERSLDRMLPLDQTDTVNSQTSLITARSLVKTYGDFNAVDGIDFEVKKGEAFGLLGPNGAGKSTTMRMVASVSKRTSGELSILDMDPNRRGPDIRAHLGVVPQQDNLDSELRVRE